MNILGPNVGITDMIDFEITEKLKAEAEERKAGKIKYHPLRPSSAGHCSRKLALELMEYRGKAYYDRPLLQPSVYRLFELGHAVEYAALRTLQLVKVFQQKYKQQNLTLFELDRGPDFEKELIEGSCDFVLYSSKYRCIGDVKSKKDGFSSYRATKWDEELDKFSRMQSLYKISETSFYADDLPAFIKELGDDWLVDNLLQLNLYANSQFMLERKVDFAFLLRYNKNSSQQMEIRFRPCKETFHATKEKFQTIAQAVDTGKVPKSCEFPIGSIRYAFCDCHKMLPYSDSDPIKSFFKTLPKKVWPKESAEVSSRLSELYSNYRVGDSAAKSKEVAEKEIIQILTEAKVSKVKFEDGNVFEVKFLKSPRERFELRRSK